MQHIHLRSEKDLEYQRVRQVLSVYAPGSKWEATRGSGGMNNSTYLLRIDGERFVLRQYETHNDVAKIAFEHEILNALARSGFSLRLPSPVKAPGSEQTFYTLVNEATGQKKVVALFRYLEGRNPVWGRPEQLSELGMAAGKMSQALAGLKVPLDPVYPPYYQIQDAYPLCTPDKLLRMCISPPVRLHDVRNDMNELAYTLPALFDALAGMEHLPHQLVHGDVNASNVLADEEGRVCAVLDFEFTTWDLRVMELAVPLSDLLTIDRGEVWLWGALESLIRGFRAHAVLEPAELAALPQLVLLRSLDVAMHFISRMFEETDPPEVAAVQIRKLRERMDWMKNNEARLRTLLS